MAFLILAAYLILVKEVSRRMVPSSAHACSTDNISEITANQQHSFSDRGVSRSGTSKKVWRSRSDECWDGIVKVCASPR